MDKKHLLALLQLEVNGYPESNIPPLNGAAKTTLHPTRPSMHTHVHGRGASERPNKVAQKL